MLHHLYVVPTSNVISAARSFRVSLSELLGQSTGPTLVQKPARSVRPLAADGRCLRAVTPPLTPPHPSPNPPLTPGRGEGAGGCQEPELRRGLARVEGQADTHGIRIARPPG